MESGRLWKYHHHKDTIGENMETRYAAPPDARIPHSRSTKCLILILLPGLHIILVLLQISFVQQVSLPYFPIRVTSTRYRFHHGYLTEKIFFIVRTLTTIIRLSARMRLSSSTGIEIRSSCCNLQFCHLECFGFAAM